MSASRLVLIRWHGDIVGTQILRRGQLPDVSGLPADASVSLETHDLATSHASFRGPIHFRPALLMLGSVALHVGIGLLLLTAWHESPSETESDRLDLLRSYTAKLAVSENQTPEMHIEEATPGVTGTEAPSSPTTEAVKAQAPVASTTVRKRGDAAVASAPSVCTPPVAHASSGPMCTREVVVRSLTISSPSCYTDIRVTVGERGTLTYPCSGDGPSKVSFARGTFDGADIGGKVTVCTGTQYQVPSADSCTWSTAQQLTGSIASGTLRFAYGEAPREAVGTCAAACTATGSMTVE